MNNRQGRDIEVVGGITDTDYTFAFIFSSL